MLREHWKNAYCSSSQFSAWFLISLEYNGVGRLEWSCSLPNHHSIRNINLSIHFSQCLYLVLNTQETSHYYWHQFWDKNDGEKWCHWNYFQIPRALSELPANWPGLTSLFGWIHGLQTPREEIAFTAWPKIQSQTQIFRYGRSIFCLPHRPNFSDIIGCP